VKPETRWNVVVNPFKRLVSVAIRFIAVWFDAIAVLADLLPGRFRLSIWMNESAKGMRRVAFRLYPSQEA